MRRPSLDEVFLTLTGHTAESEEEADEQGDLAAEGSER
jgi:hypothetical protein